MSSSLLLLLICILKAIISLSLMVWFYNFFLQTRYWYIYWSSQNLLYLSIKLLRTLGSMSRSCFSIFLFLPFMYCICSFVIVYLNKFSRIWIRILELETKIDMRSYILWTFTKYFLILFNKFCFFERSVRKACI